MIRFFIFSALLSLGASTAFSQSEWNQEVPGQVPDFGPHPVTTIANLSGIGATINRVNGQCVIVQLFKGSGALEAGMQTSDTITHIDGTDISGYELPAIAKLLRGDPETRVVLTYLRGGQTKPDKVTVVRHPVKIN